MGSPHNGYADALLGHLATTERYIRWSRNAWETCTAALTPDLIRAHLDGREVVGVYPAADGVARHGLTDIDLHDADPTPDAIATNERYAWKKSGELDALGVEHLLVRGHDAGSYHLIFHTRPIGAVRLGRWLREFAADAGPVHVDTFPSPSGGGNAVRLPGRHHKRPEQWSAVWSGSGWEPWPAAFDRLVHLAENPARLFPDPGEKAKADPPPGTGGSRPGDVFNLLVPIEDALAAYGWVREREDGDRVRFTRPGKGGGISASVKGGTVWVFTSSVPNLPVSSASGKPYTAFALVAHLEFAGDFGRAARELARQGFCPEPPVVWMPGGTQQNGKPASGVGSVGSVGSVERPGVVPVADYQPFPTDVLPPVVRAFVESSAAAKGIDPSYSVMPVLAALGAAIGVSHVATPKKGWREPPFVWAVTVGKSGTGKSPPYREIEDTAEDINDGLEREYEIECADYETKAEEWLGKKEAGDDPGPKPKPPVKRSFIKSDVTIEALIGCLQDNPRGLLIGRDELATWVGGFVKYAGKTGASELPHWLQLSNAGNLNYTRKTGDRKEVRVRGVGVSVTGTIQPGVLARVMTDDFRQAGLFARLLLAMPPWRKRVWTEAEIPDEVQEEFVELVRKLHALPGGQWENGKPRPHLVRLTGPAKDRFIAFYNANGEEMEAADDDLAAVMSKIEGYALRFALIFHCCRLKEFAKDAPIGAEDMDGAIRLARWFIDETDRLYRLLGETAEQQQTRGLFDKVCRLAARAKGYYGVTVRDLQNSNTRAYRTKEQAEAALDSLVGAGMGTWAELPSPKSGGHPLRYFAPAPTSDTSYTRTSGDDPGEDDPPPTHDSDPPTDPPDEYPPEPGTNPSSGSSCVGRGCPSGESSVGSVGRRNGTSAASESPDGDETSVGDAPPSVGSDSVPVGYTPVTSPDGLPAVVAAVVAADAVGLDVETTGLDPRTGRVRLLQVATPDRVFIIDLFALADPAAALADLFAALGRVEVVGHNLQFDLRFLAPLGFAPGRTFCTMLASQLLHAGHREPSGARLKHSLGEVAQRELGRELDKEHQKSDWSKPLTPAQLEYAAADAAILPPLAEALRAKLADAKFGPAVNIEMAALPGVAWAAPVAVDREAWLARAESAEAERDRLAEEMDALAPNPGTLTSSRNWNSPEQVKAAFAALGIPVEGTDDDHLAALDHPLAGKLRKYRSAQKQVGTYGKGWLADHAPAGEVMPSWKQLGAESGRMSCTDPNLQQVPREPEYRRCFVARPGRVLVKADYSQVELRIAAKIAGEPAMIAAYRGGKDLHALTASAVLGKPVEEVTKADRQLAKAVNFGLLYGMGWKTLKGYALANYRVTLTDDEARRYRDAFFKAYPKLKSWHGRVGGHVENLFKKDPSATHETRTLGGRRRVLPVAKGTPERRYPNLTEALNTPVQGTGADGLKMAISLLWERRADCPGVVPVLFCHDEIVLEAPADAAERAANWLKAAMVDAMSALLAPVPVEVEVTVGRTWGGN